jgi:hypothetical protein
MPNDMTVTQLADELNAVRYLPPELTGPLSMLDQASLRWSIRYPQIQQEQQAFATARQQQFPRTRTEQTWQDVITTAGALADALRRIGDA